MPEIVVGVDGTDASRAALLWAGDHAVRTGGRLVGVHAWPAPVELEVPLDASTADALRDSLDDGAHATALQITFATVTGAPGPALVTRAREADLLVVGAHRPMVHGPRATVDAYCLHHSRTPVAVVPDDEAAPRLNGRVVVAVDLSPCSAAALQWAGREADLLGAELSVAYAWQVSPSAGSALVHPRAARRARETQVTQRLRTWTREVLGEATAPTVLLHAEHGAPLDVLVDRAAAADLLVLGSHGHHTIARILGGSLSGQLSTLCRCPVVVVPPALALTNT